MNTLVRVLLCVCACVYADERLGLGDCRAEAAEDGVRVRVVGGVLRSGSVTVAEGAGILEAILGAGGLAPKAETKHVLVIRDEELTELDLNALGRRERELLMRPMANGDIVIVSQRRESSGKLSMPEFVEIVSRELERLRDQGLFEHGGVSYEESVKHIRAMAEAEAGDETSNEATMPLVWGGDQGRRVGAKAPIKIKGARVRARGSTSTIRGDGGGVDE